MFKVACRTLSKFGCAKACWSRCLVSVGSVEAGVGLEAAMASDDDDGTR